MYLMLSEALGDPRSRLRELWLLEVPPNTRGLCDCAPSSEYTCGRCDLVEPADELAKVLNLLMDVTHRAVCQNSHDLSLLLIRVYRLFGLTSFLHAFVLFFVVVKVFFLTEGTLST